jgi:hypothetical protein
MSDLRKQRAGHKGAADPDQGSTPKRARSGGAAAARGGGGRAPEALVTFPFLEADEAAAVTIDAHTLRGDPGRLRSVLAKHGVAIVSDLLTEAE